MPKVSQNHAYAVCPEQLTAYGVVLALLQINSPPVVAARALLIVRVANCGAAGLTVTLGLDVTFKPHAEILSVCAALVSYSLRFCRL